jgi:hypothetical protein
MREGVVVSPYCRDCRVVTNTTRKQRFFAQRMTEKAAGTLPTCHRCGRYPVHVTPSQAYGICRKCHNTDKRRYSRASIIRRVQERMKSKS